MAGKERNPRILVAGGSIGGLTTALLLRDLGYEVAVFESSGEMQVGDPDWKFGLGVRA